MAIAAKKTARELSTLAAGRAHLMVDETSRSVAASKAIPLFSPDEYVILIGDFKLRSLGNSL